MATEKRFPGSEQTAEAVLQQLVAKGKVPPYVPFLRYFSDIERKEKQDCPLPQGIVSITALTRQAEFRSDHHRVIMWMRSEEFEYEGGEKVTQIWYVDKVRVHTYADDRSVDHELWKDAYLATHSDDHRCVMYGHAPKK